MAEITYPIKIKPCTDFPEAAYLGNPQVKRDGVELTLNADELAEYVKCASSCEYFVEKYCKIIHVDDGIIDFILYPYQRRLLRAFEDNRFSIVLACRQSGKSITSVMFILWYVCFHEAKTVLLLANKGSTSREMLSRITMALEHLPFFLQPGCKSLNKGSIIFSNKSKIEAWSTSSNSVRGKSASMVYLDEFAFIDNDVEFFKSTYPTISSGKTTKIVMTSTANGIANVFYKLWNSAIHKANKFIPERIDWWDVPGRDEAWKEEQIANTSEEDFNQEYGNSFLGTANTLINPETLLKLSPSVPIEKHGDVKIYERPVEGHQYVMMVDVCKARGQDYSTFSILDLDERPYKQVATYRNNMVSPQIYPDVIYKYCKAYNDAYLIIESNDQGAQVFSIMRHDFEYENVFIGTHRSGNTNGLEMTSKVKRIGCSNLKDLMERGNLLIQDEETISEFCTFEAVGNSYEAAKSCHDDTVMPFVMFAWFTESNAFKEISDTNLREMMSQESSRIIADSVPFVGLPDTDAGGDHSYVFVRMDETTGRRGQSFRKDPDFGLVIEDDGDGPTNISPYAI